ncbi:MAG: crotonase/enoyl-CoA hydratase family protein [Alphaproteobacteria bacterium]|nr:crotonase/enoyl-CoA hydratase family protein [Alphaproteobacteria bacterium]MCB9695985.1 crotonase/enoyl-CoA hydratase family protein [Alphaproteobacteria bacterium]
MSAPFLTVLRDGPVAVVVLDRPQRKNALGPGFWDEMPKVFADIDADPAVRCVVLRGAGDCFTSGLDLVEMLPRLPLDPTGGVDGARQTALHQLIRSMQGAITCVERCRVPVIAAIHGWCLGGGVDLATAADIRWCSSDATFGVRETRLAMVADVGTLQRLPGIVGPGHARELVYTGDDIDAEHAFRIGLVTKVFPEPHALMQAAESLARRIAENPPLAVQGAKRVMVEAERHEIDRGLEYVATWNAAHLVTRDLLTAVAARGKKASYEGR